jgi:murein DD-endopeptidase MepM/ murein hydrolase activator NlpD
MRLDGTNGSTSMRSMLTLVVVAALLPVAWYGSRNVYRRWLEPVSPVITVIEAPRGVGITPVSVRLNLQDTESGLDEVVVRTRQNRVATELLRKKLGGVRAAQVTVEIPGERSVLEEGPADLEIRTYDRSLWSNASEKRLSLQVDYRKPKIGVVSTQHNVVQGGSQLIFYNAYDENLAVSGVKVGNRTFLGYPARGIDDSLNDPTLYVAVYAVDVDQNVDGLSVRAFAEDQVGNATSISFFNKVRSREWRKVNQAVTEDFLRGRVAELARANAGKLTTGSAQPRGKKRADEALVEQFKLVNENLRNLNEAAVVSAMHTQHFERFFEAPFSQSTGVARVLFGDNTTFNWDSRTLGTLRQHGYELAFSREEADVYAAANGIVLFVDDCGVYGNCLVVDHGLGVTTTYGYLNNAAVRKGEQVTAGQKIGSAGESGLARGTRLYFEVRIQGVPVDPREWWDRGWYYSQVTAKINEARRTQGLSAYQAGR